MKKKAEIWTRKCRLILILWLLFFVSCNKHLSEVSIYSNLQEGDSISIALYSKIEDRYIAVTGISVNSEDAIRNRVDIPLPDSLIKNIGALSITVHCRSDSVLAISSIQIKNHATYYPQDIMNTLWWQDGLHFEMDTNTNTIKSNIQKSIPGIFPVGIVAFHIPSHPTGFQLFLRFSFLATLLILSLILFRQSTTQRIPLLSIALFLASLPLLYNFTIYTMALMSLVLVIAFIYDKSRRFTWQPIFYVLCAMYLMNAIGLLYTNDFAQGVKRLDSTIIYVLFPVVFSMTQFTQKNVILLLRFFVWSAIAFCAFGFLSYAAIVPGITWDMVFKDSKSYAPLLMMWPAHPHPSFLSSILLMAVPVAFYVRYNTPFKIQNSKFKIAETFLGVSFPIAFTILCGARIGMVIAPILLGLAYLFYCKFKPVLKWGLLVAGIAATGILFHYFPNMDDRFHDPARVDLRKTAISAIREKPVFGWGTGSAKSLIHSEERAHGLGIETPYDFNQFHNQYLEDMVQFGIPGILILLLLFGWMLWIGVREKNFLLLSLFVIYALFCWTETALFISKGCVPFVFWLCFLNTRIFTNDTNRFSC